MCVCVGGGVKKDEARWEMKESKKRRYEDGGLCQMRYRDTE